MQNIVSTTSTYPPKTCQRQVNNPNLPPFSPLPGRKSVTACIAAISYSPQSVENIKRQTHALTAQHTAGNTNPTHLTAYVIAPEEIYPRRSARSLLKTGLRFLIAFLIGVGLFTGAWLGGLASRGGRSQGIMQAPTPLISHPLLMPAGHVNITSLPRDLKEGLIQAERHVRLPRSPRLHATSPPLSDFEKKIIAEMSVLRQDNLSYVSRLNKNRKKYGKGVIIHTAVKELPAVPPKGLLVEMDDRLVPVRIFHHPGRRINYEVYDIKNPDNQSYPIKFDGKKWRFSASVADILLDELKELIPGVIPLQTNRSQRPSTTPSPLLNSSNPGHVFLRFG